MAMEFFPESLKRRLQERGRLDPDEALTIANQVATALYAHARGFIHRDVKPDNIMFRPDGTPVLLDFGIARVLESTTQLHALGDGHGTPRDMSPEQRNAPSASTAAATSTAWAWCWTRCRAVRRRSRAARP